MSDPPGPIGEGGWAIGYGTSKGGFHRMAGILAAELGPSGVRCFNVEPGFVATERATSDPRLGMGRRAGQAAFGRRRGRDVAARATRRGPS